MEHLHEWISLKRHKILVVVRSPRPFLSHKILVSEVCADKGCVVGRDHKATEIADVRRGSHSFGTLEIDVLQAWGLPKSAE